NCKISSHSFICEGVEIEDEVFIGHGVKFINDLYPHATTAEGNLQGEADWKVLRTVVRARASIATNATILPNLSIGRGGSIGAAALVVADVPDHAIVAGRPARVIGDVREREKPRGRRARLLSYLPAVRLTHPFRSPISPFSGGKSKARPCPISTVCSKAV